MPFSLLQLRPELLQAVKELGFERPTPIQDKAIPAALKGQDVLGSAMTGSGKTVAFALPMLQHLLSMEEPSRGFGVRALILAPVRELAAQVEVTLKDCARFTKLRCALVIGGANMRSQTQALKTADIVIATPGRLLDHLQHNRGFDMRNCRFVVLDEADRMLDMGFLPDVSAILERIPSERQTLMFSATVPPEIERLVRRFMKEPVRIQIDPPRKPAAGIVQRVFPVTQSQKYGLLKALIDHFNMTSVLVFTATKKRADIVSGFLRTEGISAQAMHSDLPQTKRTQVMEAFRHQKHRVLVATDIAARGLDIRHVSHVINFDVPLYAEDYLHRIGRTARVFTVGDALTLMAPEEKGPVVSIEAFTGTPIERCSLESFKYDVPPQLEVYRPSMASRFRAGRRTFKRGRRGLM